MKTESLESLLELFFPSELLNYFEVTDFQKTGETLHIHFTELNLIPKELLDLKLNSHGFHKEIVVQDFPIRGHQVLLHIKRRRWKDMQTGKIHSRDWNLVASTTKLTQEFASFLKELSR